MGRSHSPRRCKRCDLIAVICICEDSPRLRLDTRVVVLMHIREVALTTNTARTARLALPNLEIRVRGHRSERERGADDASDLLADPSVEAYFLFPSESAVEITPEWAEERRARGKKLLLIVPDGSWGQCSKVARRTPGLENVPHAKLPPGPPSEYRLRTEPRPECVSTFESIARAPALIHPRAEDGADVGAKLMDYFRMKQDRQLWARGLKKPADVFGGLPEPALRFFDEMGRRGGAKPRE